MPITLLTVISYKLHRLLPCPPDRLLNTLVVMPHIRIQILLLLLLANMTAEAGSFRCGTRVVKTGDSISRLLDACGQPSLKYQAKESVSSGGSRKSTGVTNWIYPRGRKKNMVVSVRSGKVVKIATD